jgi:hypothetical protein
MTMPGFYRWEVPGKSISIRISLDVVDRLQQDVMRGFGAVPKRGAEIGGVLLGAVNSHGSVSVEEYELIPIEYKRGPSYLLSGEDVEAFEATLNDLRQRSGDDLRPVGYFRSHTRDGVGLGSDDLEMLSRYFPEPEAIVLLIRPFGTKPSVAGFYFKEKGVFQSGAPLLEFPFRRKDLAPDEEPQEQPEPPARQVNKPPPRVETSQPEPEQAATQPKRWPIQNPAQPAIEPMPQASLDSSVVVPLGVETKPKRRRSWMWMPLSFIFLLLGTVLGFQIGFSVRQRQQGADPYSISLAVARSGSDLQVTWNRHAPAIGTAQTGVLMIDDGTFSKTTNLGASELQSGQVIIYKPLTSHVRFRLDLSVKDRDSLSETVEWTQ